MAVRTRTVTAEINGATVGDKVKFRLLSASVYQSTFVSLQIVETAIQTDNTISVALPCDEDFLLPSKWAMYLPRPVNVDEKENPPFVFNLPYGDGSPVSISTLLELITPENAPLNVAALINAALANSGGGSAIGGAVTGATAGLIPYFGAGGVLAQAANLNYDDATQRTSFFGDNDFNLQSGEDQLRVGLGEGDYLSVRYALGGRVYLAVTETTTGGLNKKIIFGSKVEFSSGINSRDPSGVGLDVTFIGDGVAGRDDCTIIGQRATSELLGSVVIGQEAKALLQGTPFPAGGATVVGMRAEGGIKGTAIGFGCIAHGTHGVAIGNAVEHNKIDSVSAGYYVINDGEFSVALGCRAKIYGDSSIALGQNAQTNFPSSLAVGRYSQTTAANQIAFGTQNYALKDLFIGEGATSAGAVGASSINATGAAGENLPGWELCLNGGAGTGTGAGGSVLIKTSPAGSTGNAPNSLITVARFDRNGDFILNNAQPSGLAFFDTSKKLKSNINLKWDATNTALSIGDAIAGTTAEFKLKAGTTSSNNDEGVVVTDESYSGTSTALGIQSNTDTAKARLVLRQGTRATRRLILELDANSEGRLIQELGNFRIATLNGGFQNDRLTVTNAGELYFGLGVTNTAVASAANLNATGGSGTNKAGWQLTLAGGKGTGTGVGGKVSIQTTVPGSTGSTVNGLVAAGEFDSNTTANETRFMLFDITAGTLKRVSIGAADSGGVGFKVLRLAN